MTINVRNFSGRLYVTRLDETKVIRTTFARQMIFLRVRGGQHRLLSQSSVRLSISSGRLSIS